MKKLKKVFRKSVARRRKKEYNVFINQIFGKVAEKGGKKMDEAKKVKIDIVGSTYTLTTTEPEGHVHDLADEISSDIKGLMEHNPALSLNDALVLCAVSYLNEYKKEHSNADHIRSQLKEYLGDTAKARMEADEANRRAEKLQKELDILHHQYGR